MWLSTPQKSTTGRRRVGRDRRRREAMLRTQM
jgi:hypothetical protein